jgi:hypothetical protein
MDELAEMVAEFVLPYWMKSGISPNLFPDGNCIDNL